MRLPQLLVALVTVRTDAVHLNRTSMALRPYHILGNSTIRRGGDSAHRSVSRRQHMPLLVLIFSLRANDDRRANQYRTWLTHPWRAADGSPIPWRYVYVFGRKSRSREPSVVTQDELIADRVVLGRVEETYLKLVHKTLDSLRWAVSSVSFDVLLKTDDDSMLHISRLWAWLTTSHEVFSAGKAEAEARDRAAQAARAQAEVVQAKAQRQADESGHRSLTTSDEVFSSSAYRSQHEPADPLRPPRRGASTDWQLGQTVLPRPEAARFTRHLPASEPSSAASDPADQSTTEARLAAWHRLYAGKVQFNSQVVRAHLSESELCTRSIRLYA